MPIFEIPEKGNGRAVVVFGAPSDASTIYRRGSANAPAAIREASVSIETYSMRARRDLSELDLTDDGDVALEGLTPGEALDRVAEKVHQIVQNGGLPVMLGGEHTMTLGAVRALHSHYPDLNLVVADAHFDLRDEWEGARINHATWARRATEWLGHGRIQFVGVRSAIPEELAFCASSALGYTGSFDPDFFTRLSRSSPVYLSVDYDALDPSVFPATGNPEPLGLKIEDLLSLFSHLAGYRVIGMDFVEYNPELDGGTSAVTAAWLIREALLEISGGG